MRDLGKSFLAGEGGSAAAEYALVLAIIATAVSLAASALGAAVSVAITSTVALF
jgi:Flp pilus assembly pilin Flp